MNRLLALTIALLTITSAIGCFGGGARAQPRIAVTAEKASPPAAPTQTPAAPAHPQLRPISLPEDDAPHRNTMEWWYYNGHLKTEDGRRYGFVVVVFQRIAEGNRAAYAGHFAVTDWERKAMFYTEELSLGYLTADKGGGFHLKVADWQVQRENGRDDLKALMEGYSLELTLAEVKPPVVHGATGFIAVAEGEEGSYYYSRTKMVAKGKLSDHGTELGVEGFAWFDHQWGDFTLKDGGGWDWFGLQLDDGSELMVSKIRGVDGREVVLYGTHVDSKGVSTHLAAEDIRVKATGSWRSPSSGAEYPMGWTLAVPRLALELELQPVVQNQEMDTTASTGIIYWEGEVKVVGRRGSAAVGGLGYVELTGYAAKAN